MMRYSNELEKSASHLVFATCGKVTEITNYCDELFYVGFVDENGKKGIASVRKQGEKLVLINQNLLRDII